MNTKRIIAAIASASVFSLVGAGYAYAEPHPMPSGSSAINSGGASGSADNEPKALPLITENPGEVIYEQPWGNLETTPLNVQYALPVKEVAGTTENNASFQNFSSVVGAAGVAGTVLGGIGGFAIGCPVGAILGLPLAILPGAIGGCLVGGVAGAGIGAGLGSLAGGGIAGLAAGSDVVQTLIAPEGTTHWAGK